MEDRTTYMGGERDRQKSVIPLHFERFFSRAFLFFVLILLIVLLIFMKIKP